MPIQGQLLLRPLEKLGINLKMKVQELMAVFSPAIAHSPRFPRNRDRLSPAPGYLALSGLCTEFVQVKPTQKHKKEVI